MKEITVNCTQWGGDVFDEVIVLVANNIDKKAHFDVSDRVNMVKETVKELNNVKVDSYDGLTVEYAKKFNINIKGIIMNFYDKENFMHTDNKKQIEYLTGIPVIATVEKNAKEIFMEQNII